MTSPSVSPAALLVAACLVAPAAWAAPPPDGTHRGPVQVSADKGSPLNAEYRLLDQRSAIHAELVAQLDEMRVGEPVHFRVSYLDAAQFGHRSVVDQWEADMATLRASDSPAWALASLPDGRGGHPGIQGYTSRLCVPIDGPGDIALEGNIEWTWTWMPEEDSDGDGLRDGGDACPCRWELTGVSIAHHYAGKALQCPRAAP